MPAGTITLTNGSTAVTGSGTAFTTDLAANGFIVVTVGGTAYTLGIGAITSNTALTLTQAYTGPTTSGVSFDYVPLATLNLITSALASQVTYALRGLNLDKANWQQIFSNTGNVTVTLPDGTTWTGPAWNGITTTLAGKAANGENGDITSLTGLTTALSIAQGGTGATTAANARTNLGFSVSGGVLPVTLGGTGATTVANARTNIGLPESGAVNFGSLELFANTPFVDFHFGNTTADYNVRLINDQSGRLTINGVLDVQGGYISRAGTTGSVDQNVPWNFFWNYNGNPSLSGFVGNTYLGYLAFNTSSDKGLKTDIAYVPETSNAEALNEVTKWKIATFKYKARGEFIPESSERLGFIANDLKLVSPECVEGDGLPENYDIVADPNNPNAYTLDQVALIAKLTMAVQAQQQLISVQNDAVTALQNRIAALEGAGS